MVSDLATFLEDRGWDTGPGGATAVLKDLHHEFHRDNLFQAWEGLYRAALDGRQPLPPPPTWAVAWIRNRCGARAVGTDVEYGASEGEDSDTPMEEVGRGPHQEQQQQPQQPQQLPPLQQPQESHQPKLQPQAALLQATDTQRGRSRSRRPPEAALRRSGRLRREPDPGRMYSASSNNASHLDLPPAIGVAAEGQARA